MNDEFLKHELQQRIETSIPIAGCAMKLKIISLEGEGLTMRCPIEPNANDKGTAFAGSIYSAQVLSGWVLAMAWALRNGFVDPWAAVVRSETQYARPLNCDFRVQSQITATEQVSFDPDRPLRRVRLSVTGRILISGSERAAVSYRGEYMIGER